MIRIKKFNTFFKNKNLQRFHFLQLCSSSFLAFRDRLQCSVRCKKKLYFFASLFASFCMNKKTLHLLCSLCFVISDQVQGIQTRKVERILHIQAPNLVLTQCEPSLPGVPINRQRKEYWVLQVLLRSPCLHQ